MIHIKKFENYPNQFQYDSNKKPNFKVGDKVICIDDDSTTVVVKGEYYIITEIEETSQGNWFCKVKGIDQSYYTDRFISELEYNTNRYNI